MTTKLKVEEDLLLKPKDDQPLLDETNKTVLENYNHPPERGHYFCDGKRRIDYVIVWEEPVEKNQIVGDKVQEEKKLSYNEFRRKFKFNFEKIGIQTEMKIEENLKFKIFFMKIHIPFDVLCLYAEKFHFRAPIQIVDLPTHQFSERILNFLHIPNIMKPNLQYRPSNYRTAPFNKSKLDKYLKLDETMFFSASQRHQIAYEILATRLYGKSSKSEIGIDRMIKENIYSAAYPLHEGPAVVPQQLLDRPENWNQRQILYENWAKWSKFYKYQPLDNIREYYGEKITIYFAWLGVYTTWLIPVTIIGILVFIYGLVTMNNNTTSQEVCESNTTYVMCPICDPNSGCKTWYLSSTCLFARLTYLFDHPGTVFFSIFMSVWAVAFLEFWKFKNATLAHRWEVRNYSKIEEKPRSEYVVVATTKKTNPVTGFNEPYISTTLRVQRVAVGLMWIIVMFVILTIFIIGVIIYRIIIAIPLFANPLFGSKAFIIASLTAAAVNLISITVLNQIYQTLALKLTEWEMHRTETEFENHLVIKLYLFGFANYYSSIFYIAFFKGKFSGHPGNYSLFFGLRNEECKNGSCIFELVEQMVIIMVGNQIINSTIEIVLPKLSAWLYRSSKGLDQNPQSPESASECCQLSQDYKLLPGDRLCYEYLEMVTQFGFITIFITAFPLAPLFAFLNNLVEIRLDARKLVLETRRPVPQKVENIGTWFIILEWIVKLSVMSNAFIIAFTSDFIDKQFYKYLNGHSLEGYVNFTLSWAPNSTVTGDCRYRDFRDIDGVHTIYYWRLLTIRLGFVIIFEHIVYGLAALVNYILPDVPQNIQIEMKKEDYIAKQLLLDLTTREARKERNHDNLNVEVSV